MDYLLIALRVLSGAFLVLDRTHPYPGPRPLYTVDVAPCDLSRFGQALVDRNRRLDAYDDGYYRWLQGNKYCFWWCALVILAVFGYVVWRF